MRCNQFSAIKMAAFLFCLGLAVPWQSRAEPRLANGIVAIVNEGVITYKDVLRRVSNEQQYLQNRHAGRPAEYQKAWDELLEKTVEELVERELVLNEYATAGYNLPESFIENEIAADVREHGGRLSLAKTLQSQGITFETYRQQVRENVILRLMWQHHVPRDPIVSPYKIERYYEAHQDEFKVGDQVKLRMIVLPHGQSPPSAAKRMANEILSKIEAGASFEEMAKVYSMGSAPGGDWGWIEKSVLRTDLAEKAFSLEAGETSGVLEADDGCYLMLVEEKKAAHVRPLSEVRDQIETTLKDQEKNELRQQWIDRLKSKAFVRYF